MIMYCHTNLSALLVNPKQYMYKFLTQNFVRISIIIIDFKKLITYLDAVNMHVEFVVIALMGDE